MLVCSVCGNLREDCGNPDTTWYPQRHICYASREQAAADRKYGEKRDKLPFSDRTMTVWVKEAAPKTAYHYRDGVRIYAAPFDVNPDDRFL